jgi:NhaA family Na+:H+ antiporter
VKQKLAGALAFAQHEAAAGIVLVAAAALALVFSNSGLSFFYDAFLHTPVVVQVGALKLDKPLLLWINDGLMAIFFFLVGLEIKRELLAGELSSLDKAALPAIAAAGGMALPALVYVLVNLGNPQALAGWAIPAATDIAFAVGVLALLGPSVPVSLKIFLLALAIIDDVGAIIVIALFYTEQLSLVSLSLAAAGCAVLIVLNRANVASTAAYVLAGLFIWVCVLKSGVHATLAGVVVGLAVPLSIPDKAGESPLEVLEERLHPWVAFGVLPLFAFANAGVPLDGFSVARLLAPVPLGIALGLFIGKQAGIFGASWLAIRGGFCRLPEGTSWPQLYGVAVLGGIGFTMSLFIGTLAFADPERAVEARAGVLAGSLMSAAVGYLVLVRACGRSIAGDKGGGE